MDGSDYGIGAMRRGSYDDGAASLHPVSMRPLFTHKGDNRDNFVISKRRVILISSYASVRGL